MKTLPEKYYLTHFEEFLAYIEQACSHLLGDAEQRFVQQVQGLCEDTRCMLVRTATRKHPLIKADTLQYDEIPDCPGALTQLCDLGLIRRPDARDWPTILPLLGKDDVAEMLARHQLELPRSARKDTLISTAIAHLDGKVVDQAPWQQRYWLRSYDSSWRFLLFLYFGDLRGTLNKFSMRDLGVMRTADNQTTHTSARFSNAEEARLAFEWSLARQQLKEAEREDRVNTALTLFDSLHSRLDTPAPPLGERAQHIRDRLILQLAATLNPDHPERAQRLWSFSQHPDAQEKLIRAHYKDGHRDDVEQALQRIIDDPPSEHLLLFAEDFMARKFHGKRTSTLTDMLRQHSQSVAVDEMYRNRVEQGVIKHYRQQGKTAWHTENNVWLALFGVVFWDELHTGSQASRVTEFDWRPRALVENTFYAQASEAIEQRLASLDTQAALSRYVQQQVTRHYGTPSGVFRWHSDILQWLHSGIAHIDIRSLHHILRAMSQDYHSYSDGFPDLMVVDNGQVRFEEVKAPGDQLRKNQLISIRLLQNAAIDVRITRVEWTLDPLQPYVIVDVETTGGKGDNHRITEIGMVKVIDGEVVDKWHSLINPQRNIPPFITRLTGISQEMVADAPTFAEVADDVLDFLDGAVFVAHNVSFDYGFFRAEFNRLARNWYMPRLCTVQGMRKAEPGLSSYALKNLCAHFDIPLTDHHRALADAQATASLFQHIQAHRLATHQRGPSDTSVS
ncbi:3'-5' exoribonuclease [Aestuariibacter halophilus]|uniref:DNA-directed DNA polymerase n=1 Tax=Fluctibacter halophilus TaxID=226011 RepID=A0ABS8G7K8_9ALTE|nr:exonuclease domain-containing protein [Aestuariibacter halophilus]MCC2616567.1 3'-5' exoribonuclease [Aestuariibacter halophilus]